MWKLRIARTVQAVDPAQRADEQVQPLAIVLGPEVVESRLGPRLVVEDPDVQRCVRGHQVHEGPDLLDLGREPRDLEVVDDMWFCHGSTLSVTVVT